MYEKILDMWALTGRIPANLLAEVCVEAHKQIFADTPVARNFEHSDRDDFIHQWLQLVDEWVEQDTLLAD